MVGAYALAAHGPPRATDGIDLWVRPTPDNAQRVERALIAFGAAADQFNRSDSENDVLILQLGVPPGRVDVLTSIESESFDEAWPYRVAVEIDGISVPVVGRDDLLCNKRAVGRPQDRANVARPQARARGARNP